MTAGRILRAVVLGAVGFLIAGIASGAMTSLAFGAFRGVGNDWLLDDGWRVDLTVISLTASAIAFALLIPFSFLLSRMVGQQGKWLHSVTGRVRWAWFLQCLAVGVVAVAAYAGIWTLAVPHDDTGSTPGPLWLLPVIVVLLLVATAGGEYLVRGVLNRGVASLMPSPGAGIALGAIVSSVVPVVMSVPMFIYSEDVWGPFVLLFFGIIVSLVVWQTGGLEAAVAVGVTSSLMSYVPLFVTGMDEVTQVSTGQPMALIRYVPVIGAVLAIVLLARVRDVQRITRTEAVAE